MLRMNAILTTGLVALALGIVGATGCSGSSFSCDTPLCSADTKLTDAQATACKEQAKKSDCSGGFDCVAAKKKCTTDNKTDSVGTLTELSKDSGCAEKYAKALLAGCFNYTTATGPVDGGTK